MSTTVAGRRSGASVSSFTLPLYTVTIFLSAFLLFAVQPMFTKMVLPRAGGSPAVWNTSVVFFQAVLLAGYLYAHLSTRLLGLKRQTILHAFVLVSAFLVLPIGIGATSVREWLPAGVAFPSPPTILSRVTKRPDGSWESNGAAYGTLIAREEQCGRRGFRAVLWHQGESDANQKDPTRTLPGSLYQEYLGRIIRDSRQAAGWEAPWFVAQVSYHVPGDEASEDIRAAQAGLWKSGVALAGPDSDALKGELRERGGKGVHFSGPGLRAHADRWAEKITPWLERELGQ